MANSSISYPLAVTVLAVARHVCADQVMTTPMPSLPDTYGFAGAFAGIHGHQLLAGGGANFPDGVMPWKGGRKVWHDTLYSLDLTAPETGWKIIGTLPKANGYGVSLTAREGVVMIGGGDATRHFNEAWMLTLGVDGKPSFRSLPHLPTGLALMSGALVGRKIHLCGGIEKPDATHASDAHWMLDLDALDQGWKSLPALPASGRILASAGSVNDAFYCMAGCSLAPDAAGKPVRTYLSDAWKFSAGQWTRVADLPHPLAAAASPVPVVDQSFFLVSGDDGRQVGLVTPEAHKGFSKGILKYETNTNIWTSAGNLNVPAPVTVAVVPWKKGFIFFNGEIKPGVRTPQVFMLTPPGHE